MNIRKIYEYWPIRRDNAPRPPVATEDGTLLMDEHGAIRINFDNPDVRKKILKQLKTYRNIPVHSGE